MNIYIDNRHIIDYTTIKSIKNECSTGDDKMHVYEKVKEYICENHLKQISIAKASGISAQTFSAMLNGKRVMYADDLESICKALRVSPNRFISYNGNTQEKTADEITIAQ